MVAHVYNPMDQQIEAEGLMYIQGNIYIYAYISKYINIYDIYHIYIKV